MNKLLLSALCLLAVLTAVTPCLADTVNGVLAEERVVNLPQDQGKWYVSVVGNATDSRYNEIVGWFDTNASLKKLKDQVHFCPVTSDTAIYQARYACNVKGLPTVRMQKALKGIVRYDGIAWRTCWADHMVMKGSGGGFVKVLAKDGPEKSQEPFVALPEDVEADDWKFDYDEE